MQPASPHPRGWAHSPQEGSFPDDFEILAGWRGGGRRHAGPVGINKNVRNLMRNISRAAAVSAGTLAGALALGTAAFAAAPPAAAANPRPAASLLNHIRPGTPVKVIGGIRPTASVLTRAITSLESLNWAGFAASQGTRTFRFVAAQFKVPAVSCTGVAATNGTFSGHWVGLDGFRASSTTVEQVGVVEACVPSGSTFASAYLPFWEMAPNRAFFPSKVTVHPGDTIHVNVYYNKNTHAFTLTLSDVTDGQQFARTSACPSGSSCKRNSAEAISEPPLTSFDPSTGDVQFAPLANFGSWKLSTVSVTTTNGVDGGLTSPSWNPSMSTEAGGQTAEDTPTRCPATATAIPPGTVLDTASTLTGGNTFTNTWKSANG